MTPGAPDHGLYVLGFTDEDVTGGWQHWRLATEFGSAFEDEGLPTSFGVVEGPGEGRFLIQWYLRRDAAEVLERHGVDWRRFLVGERDAAPGGCHVAITPSTREERELLEERRRAAFR